MVLFTPYKKVDAKCPPSCPSPPSAALRARPCGAPQRLSPPPRAAQKGVGAFCRALGRLSGPVWDITRLLWARLRGQDGPGCPSSGHRQSRWGTQTLRVPSHPAVDQRLSPAAPSLGSLLSLHVQNQFKKRKL